VPVPRLDISEAVVVVTGAAGGIGLAITQAAHRRGARVVLVDLQQDAVDAAAAGLGADRSLALAGDVTDSAAMEEVFRATKERFGRVDVAVANAGISSGSTAFTINTAADGAFEKILAVNLVGVWNTIRAALPHALESRGHIVLTASIYAYINGMLNAPYAATKGAVEQLGRALRAELAPHRATAGILYPGWVKTPIADVAFGGDELATALVAKAFPAPLRKQVTAARVAEAAVRGIERRAASIQVPRRWAGVSALRGIINPLSDSAFERDATMRTLLAEVEARAERT
jgi:NAD(P)-dependent dehydrogenase (short-subunit alcohol dehydrogenase family)